ncbi:MAG: acetate--CoA ligase family protein, partial [Acetobacteraceae bacterium]
RVRAGVREGRPDARIEGVLVARELAGGVECVLGVHRDPEFGLIATFGLGGVFVEAMGDVVLHRAPFGEATARRMIGAIKAAPLLFGRRGRRPCDVAALAGMLARLSAFAAAAGERLVSVELNPVLVMAEGDGAFAADAVLEISG